MKTANDLELPAYVADLIYTIVFVFQRIIPPDMLMQWLQPMVTDEDRCALLMHEEPIYVAADFLGIDRQSPNFSQYEKEYLKFRTNFLNRKHTPLPRGMERSLGPLIAKARSYLQRIDAHHDVAASDFSSKHSSARHSEDFAEFSRISKRMPHHPEHSFGPKMQYHMVSGRQRAADVFTKKHATEDLSAIG